MKYNILQNIKKLIAVLVIAGAFATLGGCAAGTDGPDVFYAGETVTPGQIAEISRSLAESSSIVSDTTTPHNAENNSASDSSNSADVIVYWTPNGSVWHIKENCSSLSKSTDIRSGSTDDAIAAGMERVCKRCGG